MITTRRTALAAAVSARFAFAAPAERKIRLGVVGGSFGAGFFFNEHPNCIVEAVSDLRPERRAHLRKTYQCAKSYNSLAELLRDKNIDAVFIATPAPDHLNHVLQTLDAGKHVLSAVPAVVGTLDDCARLADAVKKSGLTYMMAETSYYRQPVISARRFYQEGRFGRIVSAEAEYHHPGLEALYFEKGQRTWRYGLAPMHYPTHCTSMLVSVTGERLTAVSSIGWGDDSPILKDNAYGNPFWGETALFDTTKGTAFRVAVAWRGSMIGSERGQWYGAKASLFCPHPNGLPVILSEAVATAEKDDGGFVRYKNQIVKYEQPLWWKGDALPETMRHNSNHDGSHTFLAHEFIQSLVERRKPAVDVHEALAYTAPGIVAHQSSRRGGERLRIPSFD